ncbi:MAG: hypothetical protein GY913_06905 [Proteobacteria bacterium]|nr:hypothetical protein [Pseudomonadota bacterium]MCP4916636.1 hypothetical protein [Pseudomonadota bacterium]
MLDLLPGAYVDNSLLTAVLLGVVLLWVLAERFGWPATGLVVPGYLGAVLAVRPEAAAMVAAEAVVTYLLTHALGRMASPRPLVDRVFGRDRFFLIILLSVFVRMVMEGDAFRGVLEGAGFELGGGWHSLGLVLVPLTANTLWKPGLLRGVPLVAIPVLVVYALLVFVMVPYTNFSLSEFELTYEDLSWSFIDAPREYVLILIGAFVASHTTARYGWDFGGIIVCGLLAISWLEPTKLLATVGEILLIVASMRFLTSRWPLRTANLSGLRPIVLAFAVSWVLKYVLAWAGQGLWPGFRIGELFGFGYLLPAIVGVRCYRHGYVARVLLPALAISFGTAVLGLMLGQGLVGLRAGLAGAGSLEGDSLSDISSRRRVVQTVTAPHVDQGALSTGEVRTAIIAAHGGVPWQGERVQVEVADDGAVIHSGSLGLTGSAWLREGSGELEIRVPDAHAVPGLSEAAVSLGAMLDADVVLLSPSSEMRRRLHEPQRKVLILAADEATHLDVPGSIPDELPLDALSEVLVDVPVEFEYAGRGAARLSLSELALLELALRTFDVPAASELAPLWDEDGYPRTTDNLPRGAETPATLSLLDRGVLQLLIRAREGDPRWLRVASDHAASMDMVVVYDEEFVQLVPMPEREPPRYSLTLRTVGEPIAVEVRAAGRHHQAIDVGEAWFHAMDASALLVHDARADLDASAVRQAGPASPELAVLRDLALGIPELQVVAVEASREDEVPGAEAVLTIGRPLARDDEIPDFIYQLAGLVRYGGGRPLWWDGAERRIRFYDPANPRRDAVRAAGGVYVTAYLNPPYRLLYGGVEPGSELEALLRHARIDVHEGSLEAVLGGEEATPWGDVLLEDLRLFHETRHPGALERLSWDAGQLGATTWAFEDPDQGLVFVVIERDGERLVAPLGLPRGGIAVGDEWLPGPELPAWRVLPE